MAEFILASGAAFRDDQRPSMNVHPRRRQRTSCFIPGLLWLTLSPAFPQAAESAACIAHDAARRNVTIVDHAQTLKLRLRYDERALLDELWVGDRNVLAGHGGACTGIKTGGRWHTTGQKIASPSVFTTPDTVTVSNIVCRGGSVPFQETWRFTAFEDRIRWRIERQYLAAGVVDDVGCPLWDFADMSTWTGALLGHGGVAWGRLLDRTNATYGVHAGDVLLWHREERTCLRISPSRPASGEVAARFSRQPNEVFSLAHTPSEERLKPLHGQRRFLRDRQDLWAPWSVGPGTVTLEFTLQALDYEKVCGRGNFRHFNAGAVREILNTIARIGAIDDEVMGSNGYYSGFAVLHEPWIAQLGLAIDDPGYFQAFARTLDHQRDHAVGPDGRVKSRWSYDAGDAMPGTYDAHGYYECQWGWLLDSQPSYVINVAEQFDFTGDLDWVRGHKASSERALAFLLNRDLDGDGLVEMMTDSHRAAQGSDWIDVIWAAHENAFVNAQLFQALTLWAGVEEVLQDPGRAVEYRARAAQLKTRFNASTTEGGFWNATKQWYVHWRDRDDSIHGDNLVVPVNFMAIAYGLCDPPDRARAILDQIEARRQQEGLFFWPLCFESYQPGEGAAWQFPFPVYENGDLFLAWGETGTRAYARHNPSVAINIIQDVLAQYERDGLACQRYLRRSQRGEGSDILANNCSPVVGLYRNIYGIQPKHNRLYLEPHLTPELNGTHLRYWLRDQWYQIELSVDDYRVTVDGVTIRTREPLAVNVSGNQVNYFYGAATAPALAFERPTPAPMALSIEAWAEDPRLARIWRLTAEGSRGPVRQTVSGLSPVTAYVLGDDAGEVAALTSDEQGRLILPVPSGDSASHRFVLKPRIWFENSP
jgi:hypothetical protein